MTDKELLECVNEIFDKTDFEIYMWDIWGLRVL